MRMSAFSGASHTRMSDSTTVTMPRHGGDWFLRRSVTSAFGFFSTAYTRTGTSAAAAARSARSTSGPRPAPTTITTTGSAWPAARRSASAACVASS